MQYCFASISDTGLHCAWCITRDIVENGIELSQAYCEKHNKPCKEFDYYCSYFIGYTPDCDMSDKEEAELINELRNK
jgi:hypothetical protein